MKYIFIITEKELYVIVQTKGEKEGRDDGIKVDYIYVGCANKRLVTSYLSQSRHFSIIILRDFFSNLLIVFIKILTKKKKV